MSARTRYAMLAVGLVSIVALTSACSSSTSGSSAGGSSTPPSTSGSGSSSASAPKPLAVALDAKGNASGIATSLAAGTYDISATPANAKQQYQVQFVRLSPGYTQGELFGDVAKGIEAGKPDKTAVARLYSKATFTGGPSGTGSQSSNVFLPAGDYVYLNIDVQGQPAPKTLTVTSGATEAALPATATTVTAKGDMAGAFTFDVAGSLADGGTLTFADKSEDNAHFLGAEKVKSGHTAKQCEQYQGDPADAKSPCEAVVLTSVLSPGTSETATYTAHGAGTYLLACYLPDPKTGRLHAMEGMIKVVRVS